MIFIPGRPLARAAFWSAAIFCLGLNACNSKTQDSPAEASGKVPFMSTVAAQPVQIPNDAPAPEKIDGFDAKRAFEHVAKQVSFGPRPSGSQAILQEQDYIEKELASYGCTVDTDAFYAETPAGRLPMKNILVKIPGEKSGVILLGTHYDTKKLDNFVGADDGASSTAVMLELARLLCAKRGRYGVWIAFFDGEEAVNFEWHDPDNRYGSRQMAARFANAGELLKIRAFLLADMVGGNTALFKRDASSAKQLTDLIWSTAARLGYSKIFVNDVTSVEDDHGSFSKRNVPSVDVIAFDTAQSYWHTPQDTIDKVSARTLAVVGHVFLESVKQLQQQ